MSDRLLENGADRRLQQTGADYRLLERIPVALTLTWTASPSRDADHYHIYASTRNAVIILNGVPHAEAATSPYEENVGGFSGRYQHLVRAVDAEGKEEANISEMVSVALQDGVQIAQPAEPRIVGAEAAAGGKIEVSWLYDPYFEYLGPGAAHEGRVYWDNGTGTIDWDTPKTTVVMSNPTTAVWWSWTSEALVDEQEYLFAVRIATAAHPDGIETQNTDEHAATPDSDVPSTPVLTGEII